MPARPRLSVEPLDLLDALEDRHREDTTDPAIPVLIDHLRYHLLLNDQQLEEIAAVARRGPDSPRRRQITRDVIPRPTSPLPVRTA